MTQHAEEIKTQDRHSRFRWKGVTYAALSGAMLCVMFAATFASGAWNETDIPVGEVVAQDAFISGVVRLHGSDFTLYSGARIQSLSKGLDVNLEHGGTVTLCPRSELQVLSSREQPGVMLAFQSGGAESPFIIRSKDVVMTPDWRIELKGSQDIAPASLLLTMNEKGEVCFQGHAPLSSYFHVSQLAGDAAFDLDGVSMARFANGGVQRTTTACSCLVSPPPASPVAASTSPSFSERPILSSLPNGGLQHTDAAPLAGNPTDGPLHSADTRGYRRRPQDVVGYVGAAIHFLFGR